MRPAARAHQARAPRFRQETPARGRVIVAAMSISTDADAEDSDAAPPAALRKWRPGGGAGADRTARPAGLRARAADAGRDRRGGRRDAGDHAEALEDRARLAGRPGGARHLALPGREQPLHRPAAAPARGQLRRRAGDRRRRAGGGRAASRRATAPRRCRRRWGCCPTASASRSCFDISRSAAIRRSPRSSGSASRRSRACWRGRDATSRRGWRHDGRNWG